MLAAAGLMLAGCGDGKKKSPPSSAQSSAAKTTPPPTYTSAQVKSALLKPAEISRHMEAQGVGVLALREKRATMCSLSSAALPGKPEVTTRQFKDPRDPRIEPRYAQLVALYTAPTAASEAFASLQAKVKACPKKQHVSSKKIPGTRFILNEHNDTWRVINDDLANGWTHIRGFERHVEPPTQTTYNVFHFVYDYAVRGNVVIATLYWESGKPSTPGDPVAKRATEILTKQLKKIG